MHREREAADRRPCLPATDVNRARSTVIWARLAWQGEQMTLPARPGRPITPQLASAARCRPLPN